MGLEEKVDSLIEFSVRALTPGIAAFYGLMVGADMGMNFYRNKENKTLECLGCTDELKNYIPFQIAKHAASAISMTMRIAFYPIELASNAMFSAADRIAEKYNFQFLKDYLECFEPGYQLSGKDAVVLELPLAPEKIQQTGKETIPALIVGGQ